MQFIIYPKKMKYLGTNVTELAQDVSGENYQILMQKIKEDQNAWRDKCSWCRRCNREMSVSLT